MAKEYNLHLVYHAEFHDIYSEHCEHPEYSQLLQKMKVVDAQGESQMDEDQWEAASESQIYYFCILSDIVYRCLCRIRLREAIAILLPYHLFLFSSAILFFYSCFSFITIFRGIRIPLYHAS